MLWDGVLLLNNKQTEKEKTSQIINSIILKYNGRTPGNVFLYFLLDGLNFPMVFTD
jgi:hypothetical protein